MRGRLSTLDKYLPAWIGAAMLAGLALGQWVPAVADALNAVQVGGISLPIAAGLLLMMYPVLAKVRYDRIDTVTADRRLLVASIVLNWLVGPALMFALAWIFLPDLPEFRTGLIIVGLARCIAMVIIWNDLACGDREAAAVLVALNSVFQVIAFGALGWLYLDALPRWLGLDAAGLDVSGWEIALNVAVFLGVPLAAGYLTRALGERSKDASGTRSASCPGSDRSRSTGCCSRSWCCSPSRARRSSPGPGTSGGSRCRCWPTSRPCGPGPSPSAGAWAWATSGRRPSPSPPPGTTSNWPSPWRSRPSGRPPARPWPAWSAR
ncbi:hypothetical protein GCM10029992_01720 [Glycomyces albus]